MVSRTPKIAVIGAGPAGLSAAYKLVEKGASVEVFEASSQVGGMARSLEIGGIKADLGPHRFFSKDRKVNEFWLQIMQKDYHMVQRLTRIYYNGRYFNYPLSAGNALKNLGLLEAFSCMLSYFKRVAFPYRDESNFKNWVSNRFGDRLFSIFFKNYSEKLWGIECEALGADFARQRIKKFNLFEAAVNALFKNSLQKHHTLVDRFAYPNQGSGELYERMKKEIEKKGSQVHLNTAVDSLILDKFSIKGIQVGESSHHFDHVISSMPLSILVKQISSPGSSAYHAAEQLVFRNTTLVFLEVDKKEIFPDQWIYIHDNRVRTGRISNFSNWGIQSNDDKNSTLLCLEYWSDFDSFWEKPEDEKVKIAETEIEILGIADKANVLNSKVIHLPRCYPVYTNNYESHLETIKDYLQKFKNLDVIGRYGSFKYNNQDHSLLMGMLCAENIMEKKKHNLWDINNDYEYQESSRISETGLELNGL